MERLHREPQTYTRDYNAFINGLRQFHQNRGTKFRHVPKINGKEVDLYFLYNQVIALGGWQRVSEINKWEELLGRLKIAKSCVNAALALRQIYIRYLDAYEKIHFHGEVPDNDQLLENRARKSSMLHLVPMNYNYAQHDVPDSLRKSAGLSRPVQETEHSKLCLSLLCGLPNEQDFAVNICTLLSNEGQHILHLEQTPQLVNLLLAQTGIWPYYDDKLREMYLESWKDVDGRKMEEFWSVTLSDHPDVLELWGRNKRKFLFIF
ncbi:AT-rich interactive domain-containing protein 2-like [Tachypleus tridentatus]|uniref:AT-rich interactive domain-containing protein 2-like n=1 Tax=Tachypleus tridentatus TaxID=6853 RepID=UPI003FD6744F